MSDFCLGFDRDGPIVVFAELSQRHRPTDDDDEFTPQGKSKTNGKGKGRATVHSLEAGRTGRHTLDEHHEHLLSTSFEGNSFLGADASSSQLEHGPNFGSFTYGDDDAFLGGNDLDLGLDLEIGDVLAMELGEGWGGAK